MFKKHLINGPVPTGMYLYLYLFSRAAFIFPLDQHHSHTFVCNCSWLNKGETVEKVYDALIQIGNNVAADNLIQEINKVKYLVEPYFMNQLLVLFHNRQSLSNNQSSVTNSKPSFSLIWDGQSSMINCPVHLFAQKFTHLPKCNMNCLIR